jgi:hypothetical protein
MTIPKSFLRSYQAKHEISASDVITSMNTQMEENERNLAAVAPVCKAPSDRGNPSAPSSRAKRLQREQPEVASDSELDPAAAVEQLRLSRDHPGSDGELTDSDRDTDGPTRPAASTPVKSEPTLTETDEKKKRRANYDDNAKRRSHYQPAQFIPLQRWFTDNLWNLEGNAGLATDIKTLMNETGLNAKAVRQWVNNNRRRKYKKSKHKEDIDKLVATLNQAKKSQDQDKIREVRVHIFTLLFGENKGMGYDYVLEAC